MSMALSEGIPLGRLLQPPERLASGNLLLQKVEIHHERTAIGSHSISATTNSVSIPQIQDLLQLFL